MHNKQVAYYMAYTAFWSTMPPHYCDVTMSAMASQFNVVSGSKIVLSAAIQVDGTVTFYCSHILPVSRFTFTPEFFTPMKNVVIGVISIQIDVSLGITK